MPANIIKAWKKKHPKLKGKNLEKLWNRAMAIASKKYSKPSVYKVVVGKILPNILKSKYGVSVENTITPPASWMSMEPVEGESPRYELVMGERTVYVYDHEVPGTKKADVEVQSLEDYYGDALPEAIRFELLGLLENKMGYSYIVRTPDKVGFFKGLPRMEDGVAVAYTNAAAQLFDGLEDYAEKIQEKKEHFQYQLSDYDQWHSSCSMFYTGIEEGFYNPVADILALKAIRILAKDTNVWKREDVKNLSKLESYANGELFSWLEAHYPNDEDKKTKSVNVYYASPLKTARKFMNTKPKRFKESMNYYSEDQMNTILEYLRKVEKGGAPEAWEYINKFGLFVSSLAEETEQFVLMLMRRVYEASDGSFKTLEQYLNPASH